MAAIPSPETSQRAVASGSAAVWTVSNIETGSPVKLVFTDESFKAIRSIPVEGSSQKKADSL
jgi:hypothetical protein